MSTRQRRRRITDRRTDPTLYALGEWPDGRPPARYATADRARIASMTRRWAEAGAYVTVTRHIGGEWSIVREIDGPALLAAREQAAAEERRVQAIDRQLAEQATRNAHAAAVDRADALDQLGRLMTRPPVARLDTGRPTARHVIGRRGTRD
ncbi:hypothetical protein ACFV5N_23425 [Streptomyces sp. NPDC059853]|uniref:hypothetical protein n=1 Tax=Streptomyces sp. NPDC059853 TaxID=3346973 RepID=UPI00365C0E25